MNRKMILVALAVLCAALSSFAGWEFMWKITNLNDLENPQSSKPYVTVMKTLLDGPRLRMEVVESPVPAPGLTPGTYWITADGLHSFYAVDPLGKTYWSTDFPGMFKTAAEFALRATGVKFTDAKFEKLLEENGPVIEGFSTKHSQFRVSYTVTTQWPTVLTMRYVEDVDLWCTDEIEGSEFWLKAAELRTSDETLNKLIRDNMARRFTLKETQITRTTTEGKETVSKCILEAYNFKRITPEAALFKVPAGYALKAAGPGEVDMQKMQETMAEAMKAMKNAGGADMQKQLKMMQKMNAQPAGR